MLAKNFEIGTKFKHINGLIFTIIDFEGEKYFENENLDLFKIIQSDWIEEIK